MKSLSLSLSEEVSSVIPLFFAKKDVIFPDLFFADVLVLFFFAFLRLIEALFLRGDGLSKVNKLEINPLFVLYLMPSMHWSVCNLPVPTYWHPYFPRMYRNVILI